MSYVVRAVNTYECWIRDLWNVANTVTPPSITEEIEIDDVITPKERHHNLHSYTIQPFEPSTTQSFTKDTIEASLVRSYRYIYIDILYHLFYFGPLLRTGSLHNKCYTPLEPSLMSVLFPDVR